MKDYEQFVPFCNHSLVYSTRTITRGNSLQTVFDGELGVGFKMFKEKYLSRVTCEHPNYVQAVSSDASLFKELVTTWRFTPNLPPSQRNRPDAKHHPSCYVDFSIVFEFASPLHAQASSVFFDQVSKMMLQAFVDRCNAVYNKPNSRWWYIHLTLQPDSSLYLLPACNLFWYLNYIEKKQLILHLH